MLNAVSVRGAANSRNVSDMELADRVLGWKNLMYHPTQWEYRTSVVRFNVVAAGRRSGKTEIAKRRIISRAALCPYTDGRFAATAPVHDQAKHIFWDDIKDMVPDEIIADVSESELWVQLESGTKIWVCGLDRPERIEGPPLDGVTLDEYGNMKPEVWGEHVRPALSTPDRYGWADFIGVPEGRNHFWELAEYAKMDPTSNWRFFTWSSADILSPEEIASAKEDSDDRTYRQEYEASFESFALQCYYAWDESVHVGEEARYDPALPLLLGFDFNISPGVAVIAQERGNVLYVVDEVWIETGSNTPRVCEEILRRYGGHEVGMVGYGDATGGAGGTAKVQGSDWDIIKRRFGSVPGFKVKVPSANPRERDRINAVNTRLRDADGGVHMKVHPDHCKHLVRDMEGVRVDEEGKIDKKHDAWLTHISDALGYMVCGLSRKPAEIMEIRL